jgi:hypothetical protein
MLKLTGNRTIILTSGIVLYKPKNPQGIVVIDELDHNAVMTISEISDEGAVNLFIDLPVNASVIDHYAEMTKQPETPTRYEVLIDRKYMDDTILS